MKDTQETKRFNMETDQQEEFKDTLNIIQKVVEEESELDKVDLNVPFAKLGINSVELVLITESLIERFNNCHLEIKHLYQEETNTVDKLACYVFENSRTELV